jgi:hypothetical protein
LTKQTNTTFAARTLIAIRIGAIAQPIAIIVFPICTDLFCRNAATTQTAIPTQKTITARQTALRINTHDSQWLVIRSLPAIRLLAHSPLITRTSV